MANRLPLRVWQQIQGNVLSDFNKGNMSFLLVNFNESAPARRWLGEVEPLVATAKQVEDFNEAFSAAKREHGEDDGHEHFGFKDGISQPGIRQFHEPDPDNHGERKGHPGTEMIKPGEFVLVYPDEHGRDPHRRAGLDEGWFVPGAQAPLPGRARLVGLDALGSGS